MHDSKILTVQNWLSLLCW